MARLTTRFLSATICVASLANAVQAENEPSSRPADFSARDLEFFEKQIRPLLVKHCLECHSSDSDELAGGLRLDSRATIRRGGESGPAVVLGDPDRSLLIKAVRYADPLLQMPPDGKLTEREIRSLEQWIERQLPDPRTDSASADESVEHDTTIADRRDWWSFQPVQKPTLPNVQNTSWVRSPIDSFVLARLEGTNLAPSPLADRRTLVRRLTFDLIGLPPTPGEVEAFVSDAQPGAYARLVERLLASNAYGERWGRHWLDVVRYADTSGCNGDFPVPAAFLYRNYVIKSWNADKPYDLFVREQVAGDLLPARTDAQRHEQLIATGYLAISRRFSSLAEEFHLTLDDTVDNLGKAVLGLTISCARCHEHKFDPIPQTDYYALYGIFESTRYAFPGTEIYRHTRHHHPLVSVAQRRELDPTLARMDDLDERIFETYSTMAELDTGQEKDALRQKWKDMQAERDKIIQDLPAFERAYGVADGQPTNVRLHIKGDPENLGDRVPRGFLEVLGGYALPDDENGSGRLQLAGWLTAPDNPLTARVIANRIWQHHFGEGLVSSPNDFGTRGNEPTHPLLLDYLAQRLMASGWSIKQLHREIVLSSVYRMSAAENQTYAEIDPDNELMWTARRRRLDAEAIRDSMLAVSGALDRSIGGAHAFKPEWTWRYSQHVPFVGDFPTRRRSVYLMQQRIRQQPYLATFDGADANTPTGKRQVSTTPQQALFMLNSEFLHEQARLFAERLLAETSGHAEQIELAYRLAYGRSPNAAERSEAADYLAAAAQALAPTEIDQAQHPVASLASYLRVMLSNNEFIFLE